MTGWLLPRSSFLPSLLLLWRCRLSFCSHLTNQAIKLRLTVFLRAECLLQGRVVSTVASDSSLIDSKLHAEASFLKGVVLGCGHKSRPWLLTHTGFPSWGWHPLNGVTYCLASSSSVSYLPVCVCLRL